LASTTFRNDAPANPALHLIERTKAKIKIRDYNMRPRLKYVSKKTVFAATVNTEARFPMNALAVLIVLL
jgi:hypothetical protein